MWHAQPAIFGAHSDSSARGDNSKLDDGLKTGIRASG